MSRGAAATAVTEPAVIADRERRARLANMRQELLAPVTALVGYGELLDRGGTAAWSSASSPPISSAS